MIDPLAIGLLPAPRLSAIGRLVSAGGMAIGRLGAEWGPANGAVAFVWLSAIGQKIPRLGIPFWELLQSLQVCAIPMVRCKRRIGGLTMKPRRRNYVATAAHHRKAGPHKDRRRRREKQRRARAQAQEVAGE